MFEERQGQKGDVVSMYGASENISKIWHSAVPEQPPLMSTAQKDAEKQRGMHRI